MIQGYTFSSVLRKDVVLPRTDRGVERGWKLKKLDFRRRDVR